MTERLQLQALRWLGVLAAMTIALIAIVIFEIGAHISPDGRVPAADAFGLSALLLFGREIIAAMRAVPEAASRTSLTDKLAASSPVAPPAVEPASGEAQ